MRPHHIYSNPASRTQGETMSFVTVEFSPDMAVEAAILGGALAKSGVKVNYRKVEGRLTLIFKLDGEKYDMDKYPWLIEKLLLQR